MRENRFTYHFDRKHLELQGKLLALGDCVEICVFGQWIPGSLGLDETGWYLLTFNQTGIRLQPGLLARFLEKTPPPLVSLNGNLPCCSETSPP